MFIPFFFTLYACHIYIIFLAMIMLISGEEQQTGSSKQNFSISLYSNLPLITNILLTTPLSRGLGWRSG
jgi:hypothetical protein